MTSASRAPAEVRDAHTRLQRLALGLFESKMYWSHVDPSVRGSERALAAFEQRWFGPKSEERVRTLLAHMAFRYDATPEALSVLRSWAPAHALTHALVCHWHLQFSDPIYREFTGRWLVARRSLPGVTFDRPVVLRWVRERYGARWSESTCVQFASKLLSATSEAGLCTVKRDPRTALLPAVSEEALTYALYWLRGVSFDGSLSDNPYLRSVGISPENLGERLRNNSAVSFRRISDVGEFEWAYPSLARWAEAIR